MDSIFYFYCGLFVKEVSPIVQSCGNPGSEKTKRDLSPKWMSQVPKEERESEKFSGSAKSYYELHIRPVVPLTSFYSKVYKLL